MPTLVNLSEAQVMELTSNPVWKEIAGRIKRLRDNNEFVYMESPDPFTHGMGVGSRKILDMVLELPELLRKESIGEDSLVISLLARPTPFKK